MLLPNPYGDLKMDYSERDSTQKDTSSSAVTSSLSDLITFSNFITRADIRASPDTLFVFGDNMKERGLGGQARQMRGEPNAVGIPTKWNPTMEEDAFFIDSDLPAVQGLIDERFDKLVAHMKRGGRVVWPANGIGTGLADLQRRAPRIWAHIEQRRKALPAI